MLKLTQILTLSVSVLSSLDSSSYPGVRSVFLGSGAEAQPPPRQRAASCSHVMRFPAHGAAARLPQEALCC